MAVIGVTISVALLALILFLSDSISVTFIDYLSIDAGDQDFNITVRHYNGEPNNRSNYFDYDPLVQQIREESNDISEFIPRMSLWGDVNASKGYYTQELKNETHSVFISGINFTLEKDLGFGALTQPGSNSLLEISNLPESHCLIFHEFNDDIMYSVNDTIEVRMRLTHGDQHYYRETNFTVDHIFDYQLKWPIGYKNRPLIVVDISTLYNIFGNETFTGKCNELILTLAKGPIYYDARDLERSENRVKDIAGDLQMLIGINEYYINLPKLEVLGFSEYLSVGITIIFVFVSMISTLISGVLINGLLKTSVEERIREFGIFRTLGGTKKFNLLIVILQGLLLCGFGTILGMLIAYFSTQYIILPYAGAVVAQSIPGLAGNITFAVTPWSLLISFLIGISVGLFVSISPAIKVMRLQLIESIHPYRKEDVLYKLKKKASVNYKLIVMGLILAANGVFVLLVIPDIISSGNTALIAGTLIALLIIFLIGMTLAGLGLMPLILRLFIQLFSFISRKLSPVYRLFIFRYARRNSSTILIFAFTFSFFIFTTSTFGYLADQGVVGANLTYGSDLFIETVGWEEPEEDDFGIGPPGGGFLSTSQENGFTVNPDRILTADFKKNLLEIDGIERVSTLIASPYHLTQIYSLEGKEFTAEIGDYAGLSTLEISLLGIDQEFPSTINTNYIEFTKGDISTSFDQLFSGYTCIISEGISVSMDMQIGDLIRMVINRGDESEIFGFRIVGVAASMPGFNSEFGRSAASANMGGVMISDKLYMDIMDIPQIPYLDKIFIKLSSDSVELSRRVENNITATNRLDYDFDIVNLDDSVSEELSLFSVLDTFFSITLDATLIICLFGLLSSSYSTIIERKKDIGIIRTLGLKGEQINRMFTIESLIIMLSSGTVGVLVGYITGLLLSTSINSLSNLPNLPNFPFSNMIVLFIISIIFTLIGMRILLRKSRKKKIIDIYRETV